MAGAVVIAGYFGINPPGFVAQVVAFAFGLAAASFFPAIVLGIFWKRMNAKGRCPAWSSGLVHGVLHHRQRLRRDGPWFGISAAGIGTIGALVNFAVAIAVSRRRTRPISATVSTTRGDGHASPVAAHARCSTRTSSAAWCTSSASASSMAARTSGSTSVERWRRHDVGRTQVVGHDAVGRRSVRRPDEGRGGRTDPHGPVHDRHGPDREDLGHLRVVAGGLEVERQQVVGRPTPRGQQPVPQRRQQAHRDTSVPPSRWITACWTRATRRTTP
jgi:hypothetical protein